MVVLAGHASEGLLAAVGRSMNVVLVRPDDSAEGLDAAAGALRRAAGISSPYVLVAADPLAAVAAEWRAMWEIPREPSRAAAGSEAFELRAAEALAAWRAGQFELPDYYLVLAEQAGPGRRAAAGLLPRPAALGAAAPGCRRRRGRAGRAGGGGADRPRLAAAWPLVAVP